jgi:hypothetical protein
MWLFLRLIFSPYLRKRASASIDSSKMTGVINVIMVCDECALILWCDALTLLDGSHCRKNFFQHRLESHCKIDLGKRVPLVSACSRYAYL